MEPKALGYITSDAGVCEERTVRDQIVFELVQAKWMESQTG